MTPRKQALLGIGLAFVVSVFGCAQSQATPHHHRKHHSHRFVPHKHHVHHRRHRHRHHPVIDPSGNRAQVIGGRPAGCPDAFCGCEASLFLFGKIKPELNVAFNWVRRFPRTTPAPMMAAARRGHVFVLLRHIEGNVWLVHDGNSGGHKTRVHARSIAGYVVVNPHAQTANL